MADCIFCKIVNGELPAFVIYEDGHFMVILDRYPSAKGHVLIIPKRHATDIYSLNQEEAAALIPLTQKVSAKLRDTLAMDGLNLVQNNGKAAGQVVFHFHLHLIPRYVNDGVVIKGTPTGQSEDELQQLIELLKLQ